MLFNLFLVKALHCISDNVWPNKTNECSTENNPQLRPNFTRPLKITPFSFQWKQAPNNYVQSIHYIVIEPSRLMGLSALNFGKAFKGHDIFLSFSYWSTMLFIRCRSAEINACMISHIRSVSVEGRNGNIKDHRLGEIIDRNHPAKTRWTNQELLRFSMYIAKTDVLFCWQIEPSQFVSDFRIWLVYGKFVMTAITYNSFGNWVRRCFGLLCYTGNLIDAWCAVDDS